MGREMLLRRSPPFRGSDNTDVPSVECIAEINRTLVQEAISCFRLHSSRTCCGVRYPLHCRPGATVGADKAYDKTDFVKGCRNARVTPHVARKKSGSAIDGRTTKVIGCAKLTGKALLCFATYNLIRVGSLSGGRWDAQHTWRGRGLRAEET